MNAGNFAVSCFKLFLNPDTCFTDAHWNHKQSISLHYLLAPGVKLNFKLAFLQTRSIFSYDKKKKSFKVATQEKISRNGWNLFIMLLHCSIFSFHFFSPENLCNGKILVQPLSNFPWFTLRLLKKLSHLANFCKF